MPWPLEVLRLAERPVVSLRLVALLGQVWHLWMVETLQLVALEVLWLVKVLRLVALPGRLCPLWIAEPLLWLVGMLGLVGDL